jgi:hypothetical protein
MERAPDARAAMTAVRSHDEAELAIMQMSAELNRSTLASIRHRYEAAEADWVACQALGENVLIALLCRTLRRIVCRRPLGDRSERGAREPATEAFPTS